MSLLQHLLKGSMLSVPSDICHFEFNHCPDQTTEMCIARGVASFFTDMVTP
jgi:hypothetical protein